VRTPPGFTETDLDNLAAIVHGGPTEERRYDVAAVEDWLAQHADTPTAEAVLDLLYAIRARG
jgi:hypothetical protein